MRRGLGDWEEGKEERMEGGDVTKGKLLYTAVIREDGTESQTNGTTKGNA